MKDRFIQTLLDGAYLTMLCCLLLTSTQALVSLYSNHSLAVSHTINGGKICDFDNLYMAGMIANSPDAKRAYDPAIQLKYFNKLVAPLHTEKPFIFHYPPYVFCLMSMLVSLPLETAFIVWDSAILLLGLGMLFVLLRSNSSLSLVGCITTIIAITASLPAAIALRIGQPAWLALAFECIYFWAMFKGKDISAGFALAALAFKPQYSLFLAMSSLAQGRWKVLASSAFFFSVLIFWSATKLGWPNIISYPITVMYADSTANYLGVCVNDMVSFRAVIATVLTPTYSMAVALLAMIGALVWCYLIWRQKLSDRADYKRLYAYMVAPTCLLAILFSPHCHKHDLLLLAPLALTLNNASLFKSMRMGSLTSRIWSVLIILYPLFSSLAILWTMAVHTRPSYVLFPINATLLYLALVRLRIEKATYRSHL